MKMTPGAFLEGRKLNEYIGYINEIELMRKRIKSFREYAEKINRKTEIILFFVCRNLIYSRFYRILIKQS